MSGGHLESQVMRIAAASSPPPVLAEYVDHPTSPEVVARFADGSALTLRRGRERNYPGLKGEAPPTLPLYEKAVRELGPMRRIVDAGCGSGHGTRFLTQHYHEVVGIDRSAQAISFARHIAKGAKLVEGDLSFPQVIGVCDGVVLIDVLGQATMPEEMLLSLRAVQVMGRRVYLAEPRAMPAQHLRVPCRRAFSKVSLTALLTVTGYEVVRWLEEDGPFIDALVSPFSGDGWEELKAGYGELAMDRVEAALSSFRAAGKSPRPAVKLEAALGEAECGLSSRDGDGAIAAYFRAREMAPHDPRPLAGLARIALTVGHSSNAQELAEAAHRLDPTDVSALCARALLDEKLHPERAKERWLSASHVAPDSFDIALRVARAAAADDDHALSVWVLNRVRSYGEDLGVAMHVAMASALAGAGRMGDAALEARLAQNLAPFDPSVVALVAQLDGKKGDRLPTI